MDKYPRLRVGEAEKNNRKQFRYATHGLQTRASGELHDQRNQNNHTNQQFKQLERIKFLNHD